MRIELGFISRVLGAAVLPLLLVSCGSGSSGEGVSSIEGVVAPLDNVRLTCNVVNRDTRAAVADATVTFQASTTEFATKTSAAGNCELNLPASAVAGVAFPAASVQKTGYEPQTILYRELQGGKSYSQNVELIPLAANVSIPAGGEVVMHLGDDVFEGSANSQFQKKTDGTELVFVIDDWAAKVQAGYTKATVYLDAKGWETSLCANLIGLSGDVGSVTLPGGNSPVDGSDGYWGGGKQVPFDFVVAQVGTLRAELRLTAGACSGTTDLDDFEINRIRVYFS